MFSSCSDASDLRQTAIQPQASGSASRGACMRACAHKAWGCNQWLQFEAMLNECKPSNHAQVQLVKKVVTQKIILHYCSSKIPPASHSFVLAKPRQPVSLVMTTTFPRGFQTKE
eukprot:3579261-Pleurochrysis_carterae.AAC.2